MYDNLPAEISHNAHPAHKLTLKLVTSDDGRPFRCNGCREPGSGEGRRYRCDTCEFDLHTSCAVAESTLKHPLFGDLEFKLLHSPSPPSADGKFCNACGHVTSGFVYHCSSKDLDLHPCCAALKMETVLPGGHMLELCKEAKKDCLVCREKGHPAGTSWNKKFLDALRKHKLWAYRWNYGGGDDGYLHIACMKKIAVQSWEQTYQDSPGGGIVEASVPVMKSMMQWRLFRNTDNSSREKTAAIELVANTAQIFSQASSSAPH
ncbi:hypothetical protein PR202_gb24711 [Eleusine coracana subsp. coracana]|uniref:DC1 domain-containing protein n=1 Tax=Eleusine coracana subsp. coracana TaxID=191504 RepID=A0AAV5FNN6_ELECO|nr:hypothetical protein QOZ80_5BG0451490 [Eleusine coracana subsp. coracana]GJN35896.1 hypothetical protein PR202_gb24711 [Eleusine coracana subsp. coracana]